jgi:hypothetical protein
MVRMTLGPLRITGVFRSVPAFHSAAVVCYVRAITVWGSNLRFGTGRA